MKATFTIDKHGGFLNDARWVATVRRDSLLNDTKTTHEFTTQEAAKAFVASMKE